MRLTADRFDAAAEVLCDAFFDYPAMRFFLGTGHGDYRRRLERLIGFFTKARELRGDPVLGVFDDGRMVATAYLVKPGVETPPELGVHREAVWNDLGLAARSRYERHGKATGAFDWPAPHLHLAMLGVRREAAGRGHARPLLEAVHRMSAEDSGSSGVGLTTETPDNLPFYEHFGYRRVGHARLDGLETWGFWRPDAAAAKEGGA